MSARRGLGCSLACAALIACAATASASDARKPGLNWVRLDGAESCLSAAALAERVEARLNRELFAAPRASELFVDGYVKPAPGGGWDVTLSVSDRAGKVLGRRDMHFEGSACAVIDDGVALVIAVTLYPNTGLVLSGIPLDDNTAGNLDALFGSEPTDPDPASLPANAPIAANQNEIKPEPNPTEPSKPPAPRRSSEPRFAIDAAFVVGFGQVPEIEVGGSAHARALLPFGWPLELGFTTFVPRVATAPNGDMGAARFSVLLGSLALCPWRIASDPELHLCVGTELGRLLVEPAGFAETAARVNDFVANLLGTAVLRVRIAGPVYARAALDLLFPLVQRSYSYQTLAATTAQVYRMPQIAARAAIGAGVRF